MNIAAKTNATLSQVIHLLGSRYLRPSKGLGFFLIVARISFPLNNHNRRNDRRYSVVPPDNTPPLPVLVDHRLL